MSSKEPILVHLDISDHRVEACKWWVDIFFSHFHLEADITLRAHDGAIRIGEDTEADIYVSPILGTLLQASSLEHTLYMGTEPLIRFDSRPDYISTTFYLINCLQEYHPTLGSLDQYGRFDYRSSLQCKFDCIEENLVSAYFNTIVKSSSKLAHQIGLSTSPSTIDISYDIDFVRPSLKENVIVSLKSTQIRRLFKTLWHEFHLIQSLTGIDDIIRLHQNDLSKPKIYWLPIRRKSIINGINTHNADYSITSKSIERICALLMQKGYPLGLHKSLDKSLSFEDELSRLPFQTSLNRNHFLHFSLPDHFDQIEAAGLSEDSSLGYSSIIGFRNSYDRPFRPFNIKKNRAYQFIERPIQIMDVAISRQEKPKEALHRFIGKNHTNNLLTINWHNSSFWNQKTTSWLHELKQLVNKKPS